MDTGRVIHKRYLLQRLIQRGAVCTVYQALDQMLQRAVVVKVVPAEQMAIYRAAIQATAQFAHPNIVGLYDLVVEREVLYIVQEYIDGGDFSALLRASLDPAKIADIGIQICQALLYASRGRHMCHGDLTPSAVLRDQRGLIHINNFALPSDNAYFQAWNVIGGGNAPALSDTNLPWGQLTDGRRADDTRAAGLLLYQLLAVRNANATSVEPPADGCMHFMNKMPAELCEIVARTVVRKHPQRIQTPDILHAELKTLVESFEMAADVAPELAYAGEHIPRGKSPSRRPMSGDLAATEENLVKAAAAVGRTTNADGVMASAPTVANVSMQLAAARQAAYANAPTTQRPQAHVNMPLLLLIGFILFALFFGFGYILAHAVFP